MQGLNPYRADNRIKIATLIKEAREHKWDLELLSDIHGVHEQGFIAVEEFVMILGYKSAILLGPRISRKWVRLRVL